MEGYKASINIVSISDQTSGTYSLNQGDGYVIGVSIEITAQSVATALTFNFNGGNIQMNKGDAAREFGGFDVCGIPLYYDGDINYKFSAGVGDGKIIITSLKPIIKEVQ